MNKFVFATGFEVTGIMMLILASFVSYSHFSYGIMDSMSINLLLASVGVLLILIKNFYLEREVQNVR
jgi:hypothetical protein